MTAIKVSGEQTGSYMNDINHISKKEGENARLIHNPVRKYLSSAVKVSGIGINSKIIDYNIFQSAESALGQCSEKELKQEKKAEKYFIPKFKCVVSERGINGSDTKNIKVAQFPGGHGTRKKMAQRHY